MSLFTDAQIEEQRRLLPACVFDRLWNNRWSSGTDSGLSPSLVAEANKLLEPLYRRTSAYDPIVVGVDIGYRADRTGIIALGFNHTTRKIDLLHSITFSPLDYGGEIPLQVIEDELLDIHGRLSVDCFYFDPKEAVGMTQRLANRGLQVSRLILSRADVQSGMALTLLKIFNERIIRLYDDPDLVRDLLSLEIIERVSGFKVQAARTTAGHADLGFAFCMCAFAIWSYQPAATQGDEVLCL